MSWQQRKLRDQLVWAKTNTAGALVRQADGRVEIRYSKAAGGKAYFARAENLELVAELPGHPTPRALSPATVAKADTVIVYTDGGASPNPGPMGIGVVIVNGSDRREWSEYLGDGTNNIAELTAIERALEHCPRDRPIVVHSDSSYAIGVLSQNWKAKANSELVARIRKLAREFSDLRFVKVAGHAGVPENERCDELVREALVNR